MPETILLEINGHPVGRLLSTDSKEVIPKAFAPLSTTPTGTVPPNARQRPIFVTETSRMQCGAFSSDSVIEWIASAASREGSRRDMTINVFDQTRKTNTSIEMFNCMVTKVSFPALDKASSAEAVMGLVVKSESLRTIRKITGIQKTTTVPPPLRPWGVSDFEFRIDGMDTSRSIQKVDSLNFQNVLKPHGTGRDMESMKISFSNIGISVPLEQAEGFLKWAQDAQSGNQAARYERNGSLRYLARDKKAVVIANLYGMSVIRTIPSAHSLRVEMYCTNMGFEGRSFGGFLE